MKNDSLIEMEQLLRAYLDDIQAVLELMKGQVGMETRKGKSWYANIESQGSYPKVGINEFSRHGFGIYINWNDVILDFDFIDFEPSREENLPDTDEVINIQPWKFYTYLESKNVSVDKILWKDGLSALVENGILEKKASKYYFKSDLNKLRLLKE